MPIQTFAPPRAPSLQGKKDIGYRTLKATFGDGYQQRAGDGINTKMVKWDLVWEGLTIAEADAMEAFFDARAGFEAFYYTMPNDIQRKYICEKPVRIQAHGKADSISVTIEQVFNP